VVKLMQVAFFVQVRHDVAHGAALSVSPRRRAIERDATGSPRLYVGGDDFVKKLSGYAEASEQPNSCIYFRDKKIPGSRAA